MGGVGGRQAREKRNGSTAGGMLICRSKRQEVCQGRLICGVRHWEEKGDVTPDLIGDRAYEVRCATSEGEMRRRRGTDESLRYKTQKEGCLEGEGRRRLGREEGFCKQYDQNHHPTSRRWRGEGGKSQETEGEKTEFKNHERGEGRGVKVVEETCHNPI